MTGSTNPLEGITETIKGFINQIGDAILSNFEGEKIKSVLREMERGATEVANQFGQGRENIVAIQASLGDAVQSVTRMGGDFQAILNIQKDVASILGRNVILQGEAFEKFYATTKVTGVAAESLTKSFKDAGFSLNMVGNEMQKVVDISRQQGVSAQAVSEKVVANMAALNKFGFENGVQGLAKMAAQATALRIDMNKTLTLADDLFSPEKAIDLAASLQRLGVAQSDLLDPLRLMDLAQNDPAELQNQITEMSKQFVRLNDAGKFEIMPGARRQLREVAQAMGMTYDELSKMAIGSSELEDKMSKIIFPSSIASEEDRQMIANMAEMGKGGQYEVTFTDKKGETITKSVTELQKEDIEQLAKASEPKKLEDLAQEQLDTSTYANKILESISNKLPTAMAGTQVIEEGRQATRGAYKVVGSMTDTAFSNEELRKSLNTGITDLFKSIQEGKPFEGILNAGTGLADFMDKNLKVSLEDMKKSFDELTQKNNLFVDTIEKVINKLTGEETSNPATPAAPVTPVRDFIIPFEQDQLRIYNNAIVGGTNLGNNTNTPSSESNQNINVGGSITINLTSQGIDTTSLSMALNDMSVKQQIVQAVITGMNPNTNPNQMAQQIKSGERATYNFG
jgi:hypothetical protein